MSHKILCWTIATFVLLSLLYFSYLLMQQGRYDHRQFSKNSISLPRPEKKMNFVLIINTEPNQPNRDIKKSLIPLSTNIEHSSMPEIVHLGAESPVNKPKETDDKKTFENLLSHNIIGQKSVVIPHVANNPVSEWDKNFGKFNIEGNIRPITRFRPLFNRQDDGLRDLNDRKEESSSSNGYY